MNLKELRKKKGKTQQEVANDLHLSQTAYNYYELGKREPDYKTLIKMADYFETSLDNLLGHQTDYFYLKDFPEYKKDLLRKVAALAQRECEKMDAYLEGMQEAKRQFERDNQNNGGSANA